MRCCVLSGSDWFCYYVTVMEAHNADAQKEVVVCDSAFLSSWGVEDKQRQAFLVHE